MFTFKMLRVVIKKFEIYKANHMTLSKLAKKKKIKNLIGVPSQTLYYTKP
jgi:hypothetical protein